MSDWSALPGRTNRRTTRRRAAVPVRRAVLATGAAAAALALTACGSGGTSGGSADTKFVAGTGGIDTAERGDRQPLPAITGTTIDGKKLDLSDYQGKVLVLNVWGSWCPPCRAEMPHLVKVAKDTKADGVEFVGINTRDSSKPPAQKFEKEFAVPYPSLYDPMGKLMLRFPAGSLNPKAIPSTVIVDREGRIAARALKALGEDELRKTLEPLIAEK
ncbi:TlpA disulfide reductase family protein [Streptomyces pathocidini]|uniref:TlpA family protein disulfide reductase n=1 Tax=Streptomyces pathocidini TaxID=1650571 RepID=A0ABW7UWI1_9ACTN|nr:TlpA disulfide reductase family protein [Streptomyces pathocidini]